MKKGKLISVSLYEDFQVPGIEDIWVPLGHLKFAHRFLVVIVPCFVLSIRERWGGRLKCRGKSKFSEFCTMVRREYSWGQCFLLLCVFSKLLLFSRGENLQKKKIFFPQKFFWIFIWTRVTDVLPSSGPNTSVHACAKDIWQLLSSTSLKLFSPSSRGQHLAMTVLLYFFGSQFSNIPVAEIILSRLSEEHLTGVQILYLLLFWSCNML